MRDLSAQATRLVGEVGGVAPVGDTQWVSLSGGGRFIAFGTSAPLLPSDLNFQTDVYVKDMLSGALTLITVTPSNVARTGWQPPIAADGRDVVFLSDSTLLDPLKNTNSLEVFIRELPTATTQRLSTSPTGADANSVCGEP